MKTPTIQLTAENRFWLFGLAIALCISLFTYFVVKNYAEKSDAKHEAEMRIMNAELQKTAIISDVRAKELQEQNALNYELSTRLESKFNTQTILLQDISKQYVQGLNEINKIKNEKIYIPLDVPVSEQSAYISGFKYQPY